MARQGYCVAMEPAGGGESIYREYYLSPAEVQQLRQMIVHCKGVDSYAIRPGPKTGDYPKGMGDLPRLLAQLNGGETPKAPPASSMFGRGGDDILLYAAAALSATSHRTRRTA